MDPIGLESAAEFINAQYPWATEDTAQRIAELSRSNNIKTTALAAGLQRALGLADSKQLEEFIKRTTSELDKSQRDTKKFIEETKKQSQSLTRAIFSEDQNGLNNMTNMANAAASALHQAARGTRNFASMLGSYGEAFSRYATIGTGTLVAATGIASVLSRLISEQEQQVRQIVDLGVTLGNLNQYTTIRGQLADIGMTMTQYNQLLSGVQGLLTRSEPRGLIAGTDKFLTFLGSTRTQDSIRHFGYAPAQAAMMLAQEAELLFKTNEINSLNEFGQRRIIENFDRTNRMTLFLAEHFGLQRSALIEARRTARDNVDFQRAVIVNGNLLREQFGDDAVEVVSETYDDLGALFSALGPEFRDFFQNTFGGTLADAHLDRSAANNIVDENMREILQQLGPGVYPAFLNLIESGAFAELRTPEERISSFLSILNQIKNSRPIQSTSESARAVNEIIARANNIPIGNVSEMTGQQIRDTIANMTTTVDGADDAIEGLGVMTRRFLQAQHLLTPGYQDMRTAMSILETSTDLLIRSWSRLFGDSVTTTVPLERTRISADDIRRHIADNYRANMSGAPRTQVQTSIVGGGGGADSGRVAAARDNGVVAPITAQQARDQLQTQRNIASQELDFVREQIGLSGGAARQADEEGLQNLRTQQQNAQTGLTTATTQLQSARDARDANAEIQSNLNAELTAALHEPTDAREAAQARLDAATANPNTPVAEINRLGQELETARQQLVAAREEHADLRTALDAAVTEQTRLDGIVTDRENAVAEAQERVNQLNSMVQSAESDPRQFRLNALRERESELAPEVDRLNTELADAESRARARLAQEQQQSASQPTATNQTPAVQNQAQATATNQTPAVQNQAQATATTQPQPTNTVADIQANITNISQQLNSGDREQIAAAQRILGVNADGIVGPITRAARDRYISARRRDIRRIEDPSYVETDAEIQAANMSELLGFIASGEGGYESSNRGTLGGRIVGSTHSTIRGGRELSDLTIAEIMQYQSIQSPNDPNRLFAVGRYQIIPRTMEMAVRQTGIDVNRRFDQATQDELGVWLVTEKRPAVGAYLRGESDNIDLAMEQLALEFASVPVPHDMTVQGRRRRRGQSAYGSGNRAGHSVEQVRATLERARAQYQESQERQRQAALAPPPATITPPAQTNNNLWTQEDINAVEEARSFTAEIGDGGFSLPGMTDAQRAYANSMGYLRNSSPANISELQSRRQLMESQIQQLAGADRLNTTTGEINTNGLPEDQVQRLNELENNLQQVLREIAALQSRST